MIININMCDVLKYVLKTINFALYIFSTMTKSKQNTGEKLAVTNMNNYF